MRRPLSYADISTFNLKKLLCQKKVKISFLNSICDFFTFIEILKIILINVLAIVMIKAKLVDLGLFKITIFLKKHDIIISAFDTTNNILSRDLNYIVYMAM